jgi:hypothetical protein
MFLYDFAVRSELLNREYGLTVILKESYTFRPLANIIFIRVKKGLDVDED